MGDPRGDGLQGNAMHWATPRLELALAVCFLLPKNWKCVSEGPGRHGPLATQSISRQDWKALPVASRRSSDGPNLQIWLVTGFSICWGSRNASPMDANCTRYLGTGSIGYSVPYFWVEMHGLMHLTDYPSGPQNIKACFPNTMEEQKRQKNKNLVCCY